MDVAKLRKLSADSRAGLKGEQSKLVCDVLDGLEKRATDKIHALITKAEEGLAERLEEAAGRGEQQVSLLRLPYPTYDLREAIRQRLGKLGPELSKKYPHLARQGPMSFKEIEELLRNLNIEPAESRDALPWVKDYVEAHRNYRQRKGLKKLLTKTPKPPETLASLVQACQQRGVEVSIEEYSSLDDLGLELIVNW